MKYLLLLSFIPLLSCTSPTKQIEQLWTQKTYSKSQGTYADVIADKQIHMLDDSTLMVCKGEGVSAIDKHNGTIRWEFSFEEVEIYKAKVDISTYIYITHRNGIFCLDRDGKYRWSHLFNLESGDQYTTCLRGDSMYITTPFKRLAIERKYGRLNVTRSLNPINYLQIFKGVNDAFGFFRDTLIKFDATDRNKIKGKLALQLSSHSFNRYVYDSTCVIVEYDRQVDPPGVIHCQVHAIDLKNMVLRWSRTLTDSVRISRIFEASTQAWNGQFYIKCENSLLGLSILTGEEKWNYEFSHPTYASPVVVGEEVMYYEFPYFHFLSPNRDTARHSFYIPENSIPDEDLMQYTLVDDGVIYLLNRQQITALPKPKILPN